MDKEKIQEAVQKMGGQAAFARWAGVTRQAVNHWVNGNRPVPLWLINRLEDQK